MTFRDAKQLRQGEVVTTKKIQKEFFVMAVEKDEISDDIFVRCSDGKLYHHTALTKRHNRSDQTWRKSTQTLPLTKPN